MERKTTKPEGKQPETSADASSKNSQPLDRGGRREGVGQGGSHSPRSNQIARGGGNNFDGIPSRYIPPIPGLCLNPWRLPSWGRRLSRRYDRF